MKKKRIVLADGLSPEGMDYLSGQPDLEVVGPEADLAEVLPQAQALIVRSRTQVTARLLESAPLLKVIGRAGAGVDNIDLETATRRGVVVMNTPGGNSVSAAEHALALMLSLARRIPAADSALRSGSWEKSRFVGQELRHKTAGVLGLGRIGALVARLAHSFQMRVVAYDPFVARKYATDLGVELLSLEEVLQQSDVVTLHLPLNQETRGLICRQTLEQMKPGALLINAARGGLVVEEDLVEALESGHLGGAALDVFQDEPAVSPALRNCERTVLTPHIAGSTREAQSRVGLEIAAQVCHYLREGLILNAVNFPSLDRRELEQLLPYLGLGRKLGSFLTQISTIRISEIGVRYYGGLAQLPYMPVTNDILKAVLAPRVSEEINAINARALAAARGISVIETVSSRRRSYSNLISLQLRSPEATAWVEGALLRKGSPRLVSVDGIPLEAELGPWVLFIRNRDQPGVIGRVGTLLGEAGINIASFVLGRDADRATALGVVNTDGPLPEGVLAEVRRIEAVESAHLVHLE